MTIELSDIEKAKKAIAAKKTNPPLERADANQ